MYYINDLIDLEREIQSSILRKYLDDDNFSQNLISRQEEINSVLVQFLEGKIEEARLIERESRITSRRIINILTLSNLRARINLLPALAPNIAPAPYHTVTNIDSTAAIFNNILRKSKKLVSGWGGKFYFVYLPPYDRYSERASTNKVDQYRDLVMHTANGLGIPVIDIHEAVFKTHPDPLSLFPFRYEGHYNADGYRVVAEAIAKRLRADGVLQ